jgi:hypothetical protein
MDGLQNILGPLASLWAVHNAIFYSAEFVNRMREIVITGVDGPAHLTTRHRQAILIDWVLCMSATILVSMLFASILIGVAHNMPPVPSVPSVSWALYLVAGYPAICSLLFIACSVMDIRLMREALLKARLDAAPSQEAAA